MENYFTYEASKSIEVKKEIYNLQLDEISMGWSLVKKKACNFLLDEMFNGK